MSEIQQIYCTHCTYGTSALEARSGEMAQRVLGYSARAGSEGREKLKQSFRRLERYLYYYLPADSPAEEKLLREAHTAPRRLFYVPSLDGVQFVGQICYRQRDTAGRPGSYFGHLLYAPRGDESWSAVDCLRLYNAPWRDVDDSSVEFPLRPLPSLESLRAGQPAAIHEDLLISFLTTPQGGSFSDPGEFIDHRWTNVSAPQRQSLLLELLTLYLKLADPRRENILLVVEPAVAALLFFGVARLLPPGRLRQEISFSTYEPNAERLPVVLAATTFLKPETSELRAEALCAGIHAIHTWRLDQRKPAAISPYAARVMAELLEGGWEQVDALLATYSQAGITQRAELDELLSLEPLATKVLSLDGAKLPTLSDLGRRYLARAVVHQLGTNVDQIKRRLTGNLGSGRGLTILQALSAPADPHGVRSDAGAIRALARLVFALLEPDDFSRAFADPRVETSLKAAALAKFLDRQRNFPPDCPGAWQRELLEDALSQLDQAAVVRLWIHVPPERRAVFFAALLGVTRRDPHKVTLAVYALKDRQNLTDELLLEALADCPKETRLAWPRGEIELARRLDQLLLSLPTSPGLVRRLSTLQSWSECLSEPGEAEERLGQWEKLRLTLADAGAAPVRGAAPIDYNALGVRLAGALGKAMPQPNPIAPKRYVYEDPAAQLKQQTLFHLCGEILGTRDALPLALYASIGSYLQFGYWEPISAEQAAAIAPVAGRSNSTHPQKKPGWKSLLEKLGLRVGLLLIALALLTMLVAVVVVPGIAARRSDKVEIAELPAADADAAVTPGDENSSAPSAEETSPPADDLRPPSPLSAPSRESAIESQETPAAQETQAQRTGPAVIPEGVSHDNVQPSNPEPDEPVADHPAEPPAPSLVLVDDACELPPASELSRGPVSAAREVLLIEDLPANVALKFHGLSAINRRLTGSRRRVDLRNVGGGGARIECLLSKTDNEGKLVGEAERFADFRADGQGKLRFRWLPLKGNRWKGEELTARGFLGMAILEAGAGEQRRLIALCLPQHFDALRLDPEDYSALIRSRSLSKVSECLFLADAELAVFRGDVEVQGHGWVPLAAPWNRETWPEEHLARLLNYRRLDVSWIRQHGNDGWRLSLHVPPPPVSPAITTLEGTLAQRRKERDELQQLQQRCQSAIQAGEFRRATQAVTELAQRLGIEEVPAPTELKGREPQRDVKIVNEYTSKAQRLVLNPARRKLEELQQQVAKLAAEISDQQNQQQREFLQPLGHITRVRMIAARGIPDDSRPGVVIVSPDVYFGRFDE